VLTSPYGEIEGVFMKKIAERIVVILLPVISISFTGCITMTATVAAGTAEMISGLVKDAQISAAEKKEAEEEDRAAAEAGRKRTFDEHLYNGAIFDNRAEDNLLRRTSELTGMPVDVTRYLLHADSFAVMENKIRYCISILEIISKYSGDVKNKFSVFEFDITVTFEVNNQRYQTDVTAAACAKNQSQAKTSVKKNIWQYTADRYELSVDDITKRTIKFNTTRKGNSKLTVRSILKIRFVPVFVQDIEPCYYQFDAEVEYQKTKVNTFLGIKISDITFDIFNKVYRSDLRTAAAAAIDVQLAMWQDARANGFLDTPLPRINFVKVAKYTE
jgi:hypothetical protein